MFNKENYVPWSSRIIRYARSRPNGKMIVDSIKNGPYVRRMIATPGEQDLPVPVPESFHEQTDEELTETDIKRMNADDQAILLGHPEDVYAAVDSCETAKEIWEQFIQFPITHKDQSFSSTHPHKSFPINNKYNPQPSLNQNFMQPPMTSLEDINDPTEAMNAALILFAKAFQLSAPTNNNQRTSSNPRNRQLSQLVMNMGQDRLTQNVGGNGGKQFGQYAGQVAQNQEGFNAWQNGIANQSGTGNVVAARAEGTGNEIKPGDLDEIEEVKANCILMANFQQASTSGTQHDRAPIYDTVGSAEVQLNDNCYDNEIFNMFTEEEQYMDLLEPIPEPQLVLQNDNHVTSVAPSMVQSGGTVETSYAPNEEIHAHQETMYRNLVDQVAQVDMVNRNMRATNAELKSELARYKIQEQHVEISQEKYDEPEKCYKKSVYQEQCLTRKINALRLSSAKQITNLNDEISNLNRQLSKENSSISSLMDEKKRLKHDFKIQEDKFLDKEVDLEARIKDLENILLKSDQTVQTMHMLNPKPDSFYHSNQKMALGYLNPLYLKKAQLKQQSLYNGNLLLKEHDLPAVYDSEETLKHAQESREKMRLLKKEIKPANYAKINHLFVDVPSNLRTEVDRMKEKLKLCIIKKEKEYTVLWNNWYTKCEECKYDKISYDKAYNDMKQKVESLQAQLRDLKELEFQVVNYEREISHLKITYKNLFDSIKSNRAHAKLHELIFENAKLRAWLFENTSESVKNTLGTNVTPHVDKPKLSDVTPLSKKLHASMPSHSVPQPREFNVMKHRNVIAPGMFKINPSQTPRVDLVPNKQSSLSIRTNPITNSQRHVIVKENMISNLATASSTGLVHTARTRRPQPKATQGMLRSLLLLRVVQICPWCVDSGYSKHMTGNIKLLINFVLKFLGTVRFGNDHIAAILGYVDLKWGNITITRVYFVEGLGHNLFSVSQFCDANLEVAYKRNTCFIRDLDGVDLLKGNRSTNLYTINLHEMASASPICLMVCATPTKSWLWHQRLSHLNFNTINDLAKNDRISNLPKFKNAKEHLCPSCKQGTRKRASHPPRPFLNSKQRLHLLHMDLCGPMRVASINEVIKNFLKKIYVRLQALVIIVRTDNGTEFKNQVLKEYFDSVGITHETSAAKTPQQNGVIERRNHTLVEAARTMLIFSHASLFLWAEAIVTTFYTQNRSIIHRRFNKTPYELIQGRKPDISYLHVFGALCYSKNDREDIGKLGGKGNIDFFIGYSANSVAYRVYNQRTRKIMETMNVTFEAPRVIPAAPVLHNLQAPTTSMNLTPSPTASAADNVRNTGFEGELFVNPFGTPSTESVVSSTQYVDPLNMHTFYQPYPHDYQLTKDHPLEQVIEEPSRPVLTRNQLKTDGDMYIYALTVSILEPKTVKEALTDPVWIESMQEELH
nr:retrovirus-related Pol polyprotein from transposon TNT 1-94 [Tanacetum cinerariifolium]